MLPNSATTAKPVPRWQRVALAATMFLITGTFGFLQPFVPLYLTASGLTQQDYGIVVAVATLLAMLLQPVLGRLSDRFDARRPIMLVAAALAGAAYLTYRYAEGFVAFTLLTAVGLNAFQYLNAAPGVVIARLSPGKGSGAAYVGYRVWGSVGYIVIALLTGLLVNHSISTTQAMDRAHLFGVFTYGPLLYFVIAALCLVIPDRKSTAIPTAPTNARPTAAGNIATRNLNRFFIAFFLYQFALYGATAYLPLYMKQLGAAPLTISAMFAAGVICEVLVMTRIGRWSDKHGRRPALAAAFLLMPVRLLLYIPARNPLWVLAVQSLHGLNFGIVGTVALVFVNDLAQETRRGAAQGRLAMTAGLATALGPLTCGWIVQHWGMYAMFAGMSGIGTAGAVFLLTKVRESHPAPVPLSRRGPALFHPLLRLLEGV